MLNRKLTLELIIALIVVLFLYTGLSKLLDPDEFTIDLNNQPFPNALTPILKWLIPSLEIGIALSLLLPKSRQAGLWASMALMSIFTLYTALVLMNSFGYIPCSCGGVIKHLTWPQHLVLNLFYIIISSLGIYLDHPIRSNRPHAVRS